VLSWEGLLSTEHNINARYQGSERSSDRKLETYPSIINTRVLIRSSVKDLYGSFWRLVA